MIDKLKHKGKFESKFAVQPSGCWEWQHNLSHNGYGLFPVKAGNDAANFRAHRFSYEIYKGKIPEGLMVCHSCDNRKCVNPEHLWLGTAKDNVMDAKRKGRLNSQRNGGFGSQAGEKNPQAKLNSDQVAAIRTMYKEGQATQPLLGKMFSVSKNTIQAILSGRSWSHI